MRPVVKHRKVFRNSWIKTNSGKGYEALFKSKRFRGMFPYLLIIPGILLLLLVIFLPFLQNIFYSFTDYSLLNSDTAIIGFENYTNIIQGDEFAGALIKSLIYVAIVISFVAFFGLTAAFLQNSRTIRGIGALQVFLLLPWILPEVVTGYTWKLLLNYQTGPYYNLLETLHIIPAGEDIFSNSVYAMLAVAFANIWRGFPVVAITVFAKLRTLPTDQVEAAVIDGANRWVLFKSIEMPHIAAAFTSVLTLCFIWTFNSFGLVHVMTGGGPAGATETLPVLLQRKAFKFFDYSDSSAFAVMMILVLLAVVLALNTIPGLLKKRSADL